MVDFLLQIPGPVFLGYFALWSFVVVLGAWLVSVQDGTSSEALPEHDHFSPAAVAWLRGGVKGVLEASLFSLWNRKLVRFSGSGTEALLEAAGGAAPDGISPEELLVFKAAGSGGPVREVLDSEELATALEGQLRKETAEMERLHLVRDVSLRVRGWLIWAVSSLLLLVAGGTKLVLGLTRGKPVLFLVVELAVAMAALFWAVSPTATPTTLGRCWLAEMGRHFGWLSEAAQAGRAIDGIDPAWAVAVFGVAVAGSAPAHAAWRDAVVPKTDGGGGCGGGCGGGGCGGGCGGCGGM